MRVCGAFPASGSAAAYLRTEQINVYGLAALPDGSVLAATGPSVCSSGRRMRTTGSSSTAPTPAPSPHSPSPATPSTWAAARPRCCTASPSRAAPRASSNPPCLMRVVPPAGAAPPSPRRRRRGPRWPVRLVPATPRSGRPLERLGTGHRRRHPQPGRPLPAVPAHSLPCRGQARAGGARSAHLPPVQEPPADGVGQGARGQRAGVAKKCSLKWNGRDPTRTRWSTTWRSPATWARPGRTSRPISPIPSTTGTPPRRRTAPTSSRVTASDRRSQPWSPESETDTVVVTVDNSAPTLFMPKSALKVGDDRKATLTGVASDKLSPS